MVRRGGGMPVNIGPVTVTVERLFFQVMRADIPAPVAGGTILDRGETFTIDAVQPSERDADRLMWRLDVSWGADMVYRPVAGSGSTQSPPLGSGFTIAAAAEAGAGTISVKGLGAVGKLVAGDRITAGGNVYTVTGSGVLAVAQQFSAVPVTPAVAAPLTAGQAVEISFAADKAVRGAPAAYEAKEFFGGVQVGDRRIVIMQAALGDITPKSGDRLIFEGKTFMVASAVAVYEAASMVAWDIQARI